jgi:hypothetical protein
LTSCPTASSRCPTTSPTAPAPTANTTQVPKTHPSAGSSVALGRAPRALRARTNMPLSPAGVGAVAPAKVASLPAPTPVPPAALVVLQETVKTLGVLRPINDVLDPPVVVTP